MIRFMKTMNQKCHHMLSNNAARAASPCRFKQLMRAGPPHYILMVAFFILAPFSFGQQQDAGYCARIKLVILQELTLERIGFEAVLEITNNDADHPITDFSANLTFEDPSLSTDLVKNDASELFFVRTPTFTSITGVDGQGVLGPGETGIVRWFIIPTVHAGGTSPHGKVYRVGLNLAANFQAEPIPEDVLLVIPDTIIVRPEPQLDITYFQPADVQGDDPFTPEVESPIPFTLGVLVSNNGYGKAHQLKINSQQPVITENENGLLIVAQLIQSRVMDVPSEYPGLLVNLGDILPGETKKGAWDMITSLSGEFVEFSASYTHASELGGEATSVIMSMAAHFIAHEVLYDEPTRDHILDFLADVDRDEAHIPETLFESEGGTLPVVYLENALVSAPFSSFQAEVDANTLASGLIYIRVDDPGQASYAIGPVLRSDGKVMPTQNVWTNIRYETGTNNKLTYLNIFDRVDNQSFTYAITYIQNSDDHTDPVTEIHFAGEVVEHAGTYYITPETQIYFIATDESSVNMFYKIDAGSYAPAYPFHISDPGSYTISYYSEDANANIEAVKTASVVVGDVPPTLNTVSLSDEALVIQGETLPLFPQETEISFTLGASDIPVDATLSIFKTVVAFPEISGVPASPTPSASASLNVGGDYADYYKVQLNGGVWSLEVPAQQAIELTLLSGDVTVSVLARSQYGSYPAEPEKLTIQWTVNPLAPELNIAQGVSTPTRQDQASFTFSGTGLTHYRWSLDSSYYRAEAPVSTVLDITDLTHTSHTLEIIGKRNSAWQDQAEATTIQWQVDPLYGSEFPPDTEVVHREYTAAEGMTVTFNWDGLQDDGLLAEPGWYTVRIMVSDGLGRSHFESLLIQVTLLSSLESELANAVTGPENPHARGNWAVWEDRSTGIRNIVARPLSPTTNEPVTVLTTELMTQMNPHTDGSYCVWQGQRENGSWDVFWTSLDVPGTVQVLTDTTGEDEINPVMDYPWIVYQKRAFNSSGVPWQLVVVNLLTSSTFEVDPALGDQTAPSIYGARIVWQDERDAGAGEIYMADLEARTSQRLTSDLFGQYHPQIAGHQVVWQDNQNTQLDLYGYDLLKKSGYRLTNTAENEYLAAIEGNWVLYEEDSLGVGLRNFRLLNLGSLKSIPLTRSSRDKMNGNLASRDFIWADEGSSGYELKRARLPALQPVFDNQNAVVITEALADAFPTAFSLLTSWNQETPVPVVKRFTALVPTIQTEQADWNAGTPSGTDFPLVPGEFLWVRFQDAVIADLGHAMDLTVDLVSGLNVLSYPEFPLDYSAHQLAENLGAETFKSVRIFSARTGRWLLLEQTASGLVGQNFPIPSTAVLLLETQQVKTNWRPQ